MYNSVMSAAEAELTIEKSKFIAHVKPVYTEEEAIAFIEEIKKKHWKANHNVPVYRIGPSGQIHKYSDDGEPSGTSGLPILDYLGHENLTNVALVITRYFGGIKLGKGGLVRAYTQAAKGGIEAAEVIQFTQASSLKLTYDYTLHGKLSHYFEHIDDLYIEDIIYTDKIEVSAFVEVDKIQEISDSLVELTTNHITIEVGKDVEIATKDKKVIMEVSS